MTIAADDRVMPQTREHAGVLRALAVNSGVVAVTKSDLADPELATIEASELLPAAEVIAVSAQTGEGLDELRGALERAAARVPSRADALGPVRLHVDRVFTIRGAGTVVTGTLWSGALSRGDELQPLPGGRRVRVRSVQVHDQPLETAVAGQRVAVNLTGAAVPEIDRGDVLASVGSDLRSTHLIDARLEFPEHEPDHGDRVQVHHGTRQSPARLAWLGGPFWQIRSEQPLVPGRGDRLVVRQIAPPDTLGGGEVLDPHPRKHGPSREALVALQRLARGESEHELDAAADPADSREPAPPPVPRPLSASALALEGRLRTADLAPPLDSELRARPR